MEKRAKKKWLFSEKNIKKITEKYFSLLKNFEKNFLLVIVKFFKNFVKIWIPLFNSA